PGLQWTYLCSATMLECTLGTSYLFLFTDTATTEIYTLSLHDALPISPVQAPRRCRRQRGGVRRGRRRRGPGRPRVLGGNRGARQDRKSTRLNSSHRTISYAVFCLKKKTTNQLAANFKSIIPASAPLPY